MARAGSAPRVHPVGSDSVSQPMPAVKLRCEVCRLKFWASRSDSLYCSGKCRYQVRAENARFDVPELPRSNVNGVTFSRVRKRWECRIKLDDGSWKYIGSFGSASAAIDRQREVLTT